MVVVLVVRISASAGVTLFLRKGRLYFGAFDRRAMTADEGEVFAVDLELPEAVADGNRIIRPLYRAARRDEIGDIDQLAVEHMADEHALDMRIGQPRIGFAIRCIDVVEADFRRIVLD